MDDFRQQVEWMNRLYEQGTDNIRIGDLLDAVMGDGYAMAA